MSSKEALIALLRVIFLYAVALSVIVLYSQYMWGTRKVPKPPFAKMMIRVPPRLALFIVGSYLAFGGLEWRLSPTFALKFLSGFLVISGLQVMLWSVGVRLELLGNRSQ